VFKASRVKKAHAHRYRHTLATRLLERGATYEQVADILGNSSAVARRTETATHRSAGDRP
jgi:site-specific recombinase XerD